jgi:prepilin-type N-terminal cleavage/methylation domain-containing protein
MNGSGNDEARMTNDEGTVSTFDIRHSSFPAGYTLMELVVGMALASILLLGMASTAFVASHAMPNSEQDPEASIKAGQIMDQIAEELGSALSVTQLTATSVTFTVAARNGDPIPERICYSWSGTPGGPLTRQYDGGEVLTLAASVNLFSLTPASTSVQTTYPSIATESTVPSLLVSYAGTVGLGNTNVQANNSAGQYFNPPLGAGVYAWRPTSVQFMAKTGSSPGVTLVQIQPGNANLVPNGAINEQQTLTNTMMSASYAWQSFNLTQESPIAPGGSVCLVLQDQTGYTSATVETIGESGLLSGNNAGQWSYQSGHALYCQLYGTLTTSSSTQYVNSSYLTSIGIQLQVVPAASLLRTSVGMLNHPELLSTEWVLNFQQNPTAIDVNGDGILDWVVAGGGSFNTASLVNETWTTTGTVLDTNPGCNFATTTVVDLTCQNTTVGGNGATFTITALSSGATCAPLYAYLALQSDGTQTLTVGEQIAMGSNKVLIVIPGLPNALLAINLIIAPSPAGVSVTINGVQYGTFPISLVSSAGMNNFATIGSSGSTANFTYARIRSLLQ